MGRNIFEYREMLAIISRVGRKEREMSLRYRRLFFAILWGQLFEKFDQKSGLSSSIQENLLYKVH
jgi:hypothetical protein